MGKLTNQLHDMNVCVYVDEMLVKAIGTARSALASLKIETGSDDEIRAAMQNYTQVHAHAHT